MEKFTNNKDKFIDQIKSELLSYEFEENWEEIFSYVEMPYFLNYAWSYNWSVNLVNLEYRLKRKEWNAEYDLRRFKNGVYNLDRLAIKEKKISFTLKDEKYFQSIAWNNINKVENNGIVLDGLICNLEVNKFQKSLHWNIDEEMNEELHKLVYTMRNWQREIKEL